MSISIYLPLLGHIVTELEALTTLLATSVSALLLLWVSPGTDSILTLPLNAARMGALRWQAEACSDDGCPTSEDGRFSSCIKSLALQALAPLVGVIIYWEHLCTCTVLLPKLCWDALRHLQIVEVKGSLDLLTCVSIWCVWCAGYQVETGSRTPGGNAFSINRYQPRGGVWGPYSGSRNG